MTHCAKCGAELIGSRKFCAACGTPAVDPRAPANAAGSALPNAYDAAPSSQVNPFAQTALPGAHREKRDSMYGPPPEPLAPPISTPLVSPLAASNALEQRGAFSATGGAQVAAAQEAIKSGRAPIPGTQVMPSVQNPPSNRTPPVADGFSATTPAGRAGGTQVMGAVDPKAAAVRAAYPASGIGSPLSSPAASTGEGPARLPSVSNQPAHAIPTPGPAPSPLAQPVAPYPYSPSAVGGYVPPVAAPTPGGGSPFYPGYVSYQPGARVQVTWANGQRYPGTIHQLAGHQALVVFPDGQQHWVDLQYVAPG